MSDSTKAVFLSYASQDAEAAKCICEALRAAGVEVWFDVEGGLETGDEWDAKIRRQIKECVLFLPIISANTQAREEGYFRIEWDLAAERARGIASGVAFILPVVIDDTREPDALVPDRFRTVQWTRLKGGEVPPEVLQRFVKLWSHRTGVLKQQARETAVPVDAPVTTVPVGRPGWWTYTALAAAVVVAAAGARWWLRHDASPAGPLAAASPNPAESEARRMARAALELNRTAEGATRERLEAADEMCRQALALDSLDPVVLALVAQVDATWVFYQFDTSETRKQQATSRSERAAVLAPTEPRVRLARAEVYAWVIATPPMQAEAERMLRELAAVKEVAGPAKMKLGILLRDSGRHLEAAALYEELGDWESAGWAYWSAARLDEAERVIALQLKQGHSRYSLMQKVMVTFAGRGDLDAANTAFAQFTPQDLQQDGPVGFGLLLLEARRETDRLLDLANGFPREMITTPGYVAPKRYHTGWAHQLAGRSELARQEWQSALATVQEARRHRREDLPLLFWQARLQGRLGLAAEADASLSLIRRLMPPSTRGMFALLELAVNPALGRPALPLDALDFAQASPVEQLQIYSSLRYSPEFDALRDNPGFRKFLRDNLPPGAKPFDDAQGRPFEGQKEAAAVDSKSVAVLAFTNLSDDKANEYFSDGISEELLNVLAKIPGLKVTARTSAFYFKGKEVPIPEIAQKLGVAYVVEGSVRKQGDKVRITAQLIKAADGFHVWSDTFTRDLKDIFAVQDEIAGLVAQNLQLKMGLTTPRAAMADNPEASRLYFEALAAWNQRTPAGLTRAHALLTQALDLEPGFARAKALLSQTVSVGFADSLPGMSATRALQLAEEALALDPQLAQAHAARGLVLDALDRAAESLAELRCAVELDPNYAAGHQWLARRLAGEGRMEEALGSLRRAAELDPLSHRILDNYAQALAFSGDVPAALETIDRALQLQPTSVQARRFRASYLLDLGRINEVVAVLADPEVAEAAWFTRARLLMVLNRPDEVQTLLAAARNDFERGAILCVMGRAGEGWRLLQPLRSVMRELILWQLAEFLPREDPAFQQALAEWGLAEAWGRAEAWRAAHPVKKGKPTP